MPTKRMQKNLTVMFTDISGFTKHTETISRDALMARLETHNDLLMPIIAHFDGKIVKTIGDAFLITFESPTNGVQCGLFMQYTLAKWNADKDSATQIHIKVSINSGEVTVTENDVFGDPVNVAAKIEKATNPDEIYFTEAVFLAMVKAEVPTTFVKTFRPKGAESQEIKLYRVAQEEDNERYKKIIASTHIDKEKTKTRVLELSNVAEREFNRYQDTLEELVKAQGKGSRGVIAAVIAAALILAVAIIVGFSMFKTSDEQRVIDASRAFLANDKPEDAREQLLNFITDNGDSDAINQALESVRTYEVNHATVLATELLADGRPADAIAALNNALKKDKAGKAQQELLDRAGHFMAALEYMADGDAAKALESAEKAQSKATPNKHIDLVIDKSKVIANARSVLENEEAAKNKASSLIIHITNTFGKDTDNEHALAVLKELLILHLYWTARSDAKTMAQALEELEENRLRFPRIPDWTLMRRAVALGGLWDYAADNNSRKNWFSAWDNAWKKHQSLLEAFGREDNNFQYKFGREVFLIHIGMQSTTTPGMYKLQVAIQKDSSLIESNRAELLEMCKEWLDRTTNGESLVRELIRSHFYGDLRSDLQANLTATYDSNGNAKPDTSTRITAFALCSERLDLEAIKDPYAYFVENFEILLKNEWEDKIVRGKPYVPKISRANVAALFALDMSEDDFKETLMFIEGAISDYQQKTKWYSYRYSINTMNDMLEDLKAAHPEYEGIDE
ncbi:MAG: adenylate/guanylate cyclase domain-containing protein [Planctomycetota bacterium]